MKSPFGFIVIDKPAGLTSHDCVNRIRRVFQIKRVGHGGTLDPEVTGVLPIAIGHATRLLPYLPGEKTYRATIKLGKRTTTDDIHGEIISSKSLPTLSKALLDEYLNEFRGIIQQIPPKVSSVHINGERSYVKFRKGEFFNLDPKEVRIEELLLKSWDQKTGCLEIKAHCSSGTYIRSLARDLGEKIGCGGCLAKLRRTQALGFHEIQAQQLPKEQVADQSQANTILNPLEALKHLPKLQLRSKEELFSWRTGRSIKVSPERYQPALDLATQTKKPLTSIVVTDCLGEIAGMANWVECSILQPKVVFNAIG